MPLKPYVVRELLEDADIFGYIRSGALATIYDQQASIINAHLSDDLSIDQISKVIWNAFYSELCVCEGFTLDKKEAVAILGEPIRFQSIARDIRKKNGF